MQRLQERDNVASDLGGGCDSGRSSGRRAAVTSLAYIKSSNTINKHGLVLMALMLLLLLTHVDDSIKHRPKMLKEHGETQENRHKHEALSSRGTLGLQTCNRLAR